MRRVRIRFTDGDWEEWESEIVPQVKDNYVLVGAGSVNVMIPMRCIKFLESEELSE